MVTVSIFTMQEAIRRVQVDYKIPHNTNSHTSPDATEDINEIMEYLFTQTIQLYTPLRSGNDQATPGRDLLVEGSAYSGTAGAFNNFRRDTRNVVNHGIGHAAGATAQEDIEEEEASIDLGADVGIDIEDLAMDEEEFPVGTDLADFVAMYHEMIDELSGDM